MQTRFTEEQRLDPDIARSEKILRTCVHCGFCTATCPTYLLLGDELDSPRGRIVLIKDMLETGRMPTPSVVQHLDRCLSCLACTTTCPSGVDYMHLIDHGRAYVETHYRRPALQRWLRRALGVVMPRPRLFRALMLLAQPVGLVSRWLPARLRGVLRLVPRHLPAPSSLERPQTVAAIGTRRKRVALLTGCVQQALAPEINEATVRLLTRHGCEVVITKGVGCCGAVPHHLGQEAAARRMARANVDAWFRELDGAELDAIIVNASGCGTMLKDYGVILESEERGARIAGLVRDISEFMDELGLLPATPGARPIVAYHGACSLQHGQKITAPPRTLLKAAGFEVREIPEGHLCCGSAGTYNLLQPEIAGQLLARKIGNIERTGAEVVVTGNLGCITQIASGTTRPVLHIAQLLDWATGGPAPEGLPNVP